MGDQLAGQVRAADRADASPGDARSLSDAHHVVLMQPRLCLSPHLAVSPRALAALEGVQLVVEIAQLGQPVPARAQTGAPGGGGSISRATVAASRTASCSALGRLRAVAMRHRCLPGTASARRRLVTPCTAGALAPLVQPPDPERETTPRTRASTDAETRKAARPAPPGSPPRAKNGHRLPRLGRPGEPSSTQIRAHAARDGLHAVARAAGTGTRPPHTATARSARPRLAEGAAEARDPLRGRGRSLTRPTRRPSTGSTPSTGVTARAEWRRRGRSAVTPTVEPGGAKS